MATLNCGERVYAMDSKKELLVVATADNKVHTVDLREPTKFLRSLDVGAHPRYGQFRHQIKALACFPDGKGWAAGSIDGRVAVGCVDKPDEDDAYVLLFLFRFILFPPFTSLYSENSYLLYLSTTCLSYVSGFPLPFSPFIP